MLPLRVLLVEDSPLIRERLAESLVESRSHRNRRPGRQRAGRDRLLAAAPWDAMVLDLQLKHGTGLGVLRALISRRRRRTPR